MNIPQIIFSLPPGLRRHKLVRFLLWLSPESRYQEVRFNGYGRIFVDLSDPCPRQYFLRQSFEPHFFAVARPFLEKGGVFFDVGANVGFCTFGLAGLLPEADIEFHLFEANEDLVQLQYRSMDLHPGRKIFPNHACVTHHGGFSKLKLVREDLGSSHIAETGTHKVPNLLLDDYIRDRHIKRVDFLKLDVEGCERAALEGAAASLCRGDIPVVYTEMIETNLNRYGVRPVDLLEMLDSAGFDAFYCMRQDVPGDAMSQPSFFLDHPAGRLELKRADPRRVPAGVHTNVLAVHRISPWTGKIKTSDS